MQCPNCSSIEIEFIENAGQAVCVQCGTVLEENTIVSTVEFQESGDRSHVIGQFVSATSSKVLNPALFCFLLLFLLHFTHLSTPLSLTGIWKWFKR